MCIGLNLFQLKSTTEFMGSEYISRAPIRGDSSQAHCPPHGIHKLTNDCLELIFIALDGCPWSLCIAAQVNRRWYDVARRPSVWRALVIDKPSLHEAYRRLLLSEYLQPQLQSIHSLTVRKPRETQRHSHLCALPFSRVRPIHVVTVNLCLFEIHLIIQKLGPFETLECIKVETWCDLRRFSFDLLQEDKLKTFHCEFVDGGVSGFASLHDFSVYDGYPEELTDLRVICVRDEEQRQQRNIMQVLDLPQYIGEEEDGINRDQMLERWERIEKSLVQKYSFFRHIRPTHVEFGFCYAWTYAVWDLVYSLCSGLESVTLHGWHQFWSLNQDLRNGDGMKIRSRAEQKMKQCFSAMQRLEKLELTDFYIGFGLLNTRFPSIRLVNITYSDAFLSYIHQPDDVWRLIQPVMKFAATAFEKSSKQGKTLALNMHPELIRMIRQHPMFQQESFTDRLRSSLAADVQLQFLGKC
ncbi:hypothetical protein EC973_003389 [Apophysomyces ossiformis]|uniref:F-box domain-containing protein n=1 Tax=Apophysomyces ossiformis TaxID=679940 RepID=A0A8H7ES89_9FUNG|nr:hypothetical protein EC973_003389 [Apophysomyces ossiformis]